MYCKSHTLKYFIKSVPAIFEQTIKCRYSHYGNLNENMGKKYKIHTKHVVTFYYLHAKALMSYFLTNISIGQFH